MIFYYLEEGDMGVEEDMNLMKINIFLFLFCFVCGCAATVPETEYAKVKKDLETCKDNAAFYESVFNCISLMHVGDYVQAEPYCDIAGAIQPNNDKYQLIMQMLEQEKAAFTEAVMR